MVYNNRNKNTLFLKIGWFSGTGIFSSMFSRYYRLNDLVSSSNHNILRNNLNNCKFIWSIKFDPVNYIEVVELFHVEILCSFCNYWER